mmetsp:Transcript_3400/g.5735  ORF Transcript_3400/g.5735 Transcript_3400/m.5735 type:complete len:233 (-) Transcript_3400:144-842(-)
MSVVEVLDNAEDGGVVVGVQLVGSLPDVVLNAVAVSVIDSVGADLPLEQAGVLKVLGSLDHADEAGELGLEVLVVRLVLASGINLGAHVYLLEDGGLLGEGLLLSLGCSLGTHLSLLGSLGGGLFGGKTSRPGIFPVANVSGDLSIVGVVHVLNVRAEDLLPEAVQLFLRLLHVVLNAIAVLIHNPPVLILLNVNLLLGHEDGVLELDQGLLGDSSSGSLDLLSDFLASDLS